MKQSTKPMAFSPNLAYALLFSAITVMLVLGFAVFGPEAHAAGQSFTHRFIYAKGGMQSRFHCDDSTIARLRTASMLGYNALVTINNEFGYLEKATPDYLNNVKRTVAEANKLNMALIPNHFYQGRAAQNDFNLSEAMPVRGTKFVVSNGKAHAIGDHETGFKNGDFEQVSGGKPAGWQLINMPGATVQTSGAKSGSACLKISGAQKYARIVQKITLKPFRAYRLSVWVSTKGYTNYADAKFRVAVSSREPLLDKRYRPFGTPKTWTTVSPNQSWKLCQNDFNSLQNTSATLNFIVSGAGNAQQGTIWLDNMKLEEVGLYETVRRRTAPVVVKSADGSTMYEEGKDYEVDPKCNTFTDASWNYQGHLVIPQGSPIQNGQELRVSWYQIADVEQVFPESNFCIHETFEAYRDDVQRTDRIIGHKKWVFMEFDEWRTAFWDDRCELFPKARTAGEYMAGALSKSIGVVAEANPYREAYMWNDMYDPYHNAWKPYGMTNGGCLESWKDMDTNLIIVNWNACGNHWRNKSLRFFMGIDDSLNPQGRVNRQIVSVMDAGGAAAWLTLVDKAEKDGGRGVIGISYVDWDANYSQMAAIKNTCVAHGRWGSGPLPENTSRRFDVTPNGINSATPSKPTASRLSARSGQNRRIHIRYNLAQNANAEMTIVDLCGRRIAKLVGNDRKMGTHRITWNASNLPSGVYFLNLDLDGASHLTKKITIL